jgi:hypothetical protein
MPELGSSGSVRGALSNERPYRDQFIFGRPFSQLSHFRGPAQITFFRSVTHLTLLR